MLTMYTDINEKFTINTILGEGTYGKVYCVTDITGNKYALKIRKLCDQYIIDPITLRELSILSKISHPFTAKIHKIFIGNLDDILYICTLMDLYNPIINIDWHIQDKRTIIKIFIQIVRALYYLKKIGYIHNDLSLKNIMIHNDAKIIDFGFCRKIYRKYNRKLAPTINVRPIEQLCNIHNINIHTIDTWCLGHVLYYFLTNKLVSYNVTAHDIITDIVNIFGKYDNFDMSINPILNILNIYHEKEVNLLRKLMNYNPQQRPSIEKLMNYIEKLYSCNPTPQVHIYNLDKGKTVSIIDENMMTNILFKISRLVNANNLSNEIIFHTVYNLKKIYGRDTTVSLDLIMEFVILLFWIATKIISTRGYNLMYITDLMHTHQIVPSDTIGKHNRLCELLNWNLDPDTIYSYTQYIPKEYHKTYLYLNYILLFTKDNENYSEFIKATVVYIIVKMYSGIDHTDMDDEILSALHNKYICLNDLIKNYQKITNIIKYLYTNPDFKHMIDNTIRWNKIDYNDLLENWIHSLRDVLYRDLNPVTISSRVI